MGAFVGLVGVRFGLKWADPIAGFAVTLFIVHVAREVFEEILGHLMDGVDAEHVEAAQKAVESVPGVERAAVRGRWMGRSLLLEVEGQVAPELTVAEADRLAGPVKDAIYDAVEEARRVVWIPRPAGTASG